MGGVIDARMYQKKMPPGKVMMNIPSRQEYRIHESWGHPGGGLAWTLLVSLLFFRVDVPHDIVGEAKDLVARALGHFGESLRLGLVLKGVAWEVDACVNVFLLASLIRVLGRRLGRRTGPVNVGLDDDVDAANPIKFHFIVLVVSPVAHAGHVGPAGVILLVSCAERSQS